MAKSFDELVKRTTTKRTRDRALARTKELIAELPVAELRQLAGKTQRELAEIIGIKQPSLAKLRKPSGTVPILRSPRSKMGLSPFRDGLRRH